MYYPYRESGAGEGSGLKVLLSFNANTNTNISNNSINYGLFVMVKRPEEWSTTLFQVIADSDNSFLIRPKLTKTDSNVKALSPTLRNCIFDVSLNILISNISKPISTTNFFQIHFSLGRKRLCLLQRNYGCGISPTKLHHTMSPGVFIG